MAARKHKVHPYDQVVCLFQGGGALGAYQVGVCQALCAATCSPNWAVGTSIGAINAAIFAGNKPEQRLEKLKKFWHTIATQVPTFLATQNESQKILKTWSAQQTLFFGQNGFFSPRLINPWCLPKNTPDKLSFYDATGLHAMLQELIDFDLINRAEMRLSLGAVCVASSEFVYFDNTKRRIGPEHIMASCALPPGFPAVEVDGKMYWDGGISSNTPINILLEEKTPCKLLCFTVELFEPVGALPSTMDEVLKRHKDIMYSSHYKKFINLYSDMHCLRYALYQLSKKIPTDKADRQVKKILSFGHPTSLNIIRFHYKGQESDLFSKDYEFSLQSIAERMQAGVDDVQKAKKSPDWLAPIPDDVGVVLHDF